MQIHQAPKVFKLLTMLGEDATIIDHVLYDDESTALRVQCIVKYTSERAAAPDFKSGVTVVHALLVALYDQADRLLVDLEVYMRDQLPEHERSRTYPVVIVGVLRAANMLYVNKEYEKNLKFRRALTPTLGRMLARYAESLEGTLGDQDQWLTSQFYSAIDEFLKDHATKNDEHNDRAYMLLEELKQVKLFSHGCTKFFGQLTHRVLSSLPLKKQVEILRVAVGENPTAA